MSACADDTLIAALSHDRTPKFLATLDTLDVPNCVPVTTIFPYDGVQTLVFGEFFMNKTRRNLLDNPRVAVAVMDDAFRSWRIRGRFLGFQETGDWVEYVNRMPLFRYNAYTSARAAGGIAVETVEAAPPLAKAGLAIRFARARAAGLLLHRSRLERPCMPGRVQEKFRRLHAVRAAAWRDGGSPHACCLMSGVAAGADRIILDDPLFNACAGALPLGSALALAIITPEPVAYQVKGRYAGAWRGMRLLACTECYSASPPLLGERLDSLDRVTVSKE